jgi:hypothetical protein
MKTMHHRGSEKSIGNDNSGVDVCSRSSSVRSNAGPLINPLFNLFCSGTTFEKTNDNFHATNIEQQHELISFPTKEEAEKMIADA